MKTQFLYGLLVLAMGSFGACQSGTQSNEDTHTVAIEQEETGQIVTTSLTDAAGQKLDLAFDNAAGTATLVLDGDTIRLTQETMASGVRYSNDNYVYAEHQGNVTLTKDGESIFQITP